VGSRRCSPTWFGVSIVLGSSLVEHEKVKWQRGGTRPIGLTSLVEFAATNGLTVTLQSDEGDEIHIEGDTTDAERVRERAPDLRLEQQG
jgi:hypothetical protein